MQRAVFHVQHSWWRSWKHSPVACSTLTSDRAAKKESALCTQIIVKKCRRKYSEFAAKNRLALTAGIREYGRALCSGKSLCAQLLLPLDVINCFVCVCVCIFLFFALFLFLLFFFRCCFQCKKRSYPVGKLTFWSPASLFVAVFVLVLQIC